MIGIMTTSRLVVGVDPVHLVPTLREHDLHTSKSTLPDGRAVITRRVLNLTVMVAGDEVTRGQCVTRPTRSGDVSVHLARESRPKQPRQPRPTPSRLRQSAGVRVRVPCPLLPLERIPDN